MSRRSKFPKTGEDLQLDAYWRRSTRGPLFIEVRLGRDAWPARPWDSLGKTGRAAERRLDGVIVLGEKHDGDHGARSHQAFAESVPRWREAARECEVIEVKAGLSEYVIGQALVGRWLFEQQVGLPIARTLILARHQDTAMQWVAKQLGIAVDNPREPGRQVPTRSRYQYAVRDVELQRIDLYQRNHGGTGMWLTRVPIAGDAWETSGDQRPAAQTFVPFIRVPGESSKGVVVFEPRHRKLLDRDDLELVCVSRHRLGRGAVGLAASHALLFRQRYGRPVARCRIVCGVTDLAVEAACGAIGGSHGLPPVEIVEVGGVAATDVDPRGVEP